MMNARAVLVVTMVGLSAVLGNACSNAPKCSPSNCALGCCDARDTCQAGTSDGQCGGLGAACSACSLGQSCQFGRCSAIGGTGGNGGSGGGTTGGGAGGSAGGGTGTGGGTGGAGGGAGACGPSNCNGCCAGALCVSAPNNANNTSCGSAGNACQDCASSGQTCNGATFTCGSSGPGGGGGGSSCGPQNCNGCCTFNGCVGVPNNNNNTTCGRAGNACVDCAAVGTTCNSSTSTCGSTGTGGGGPTGGGGGTCDGCRLPSGTCVPAQLSGSNVINCGLGGVVCVACASGELCTNGACQVSAPTKRVGDTCVSDAQCQASLGASALCKQTTTSGNGTYAGGYCTLRCPAATCPTGSTCVGLLPQYGEESICWDNCAGNDPCRTPGYGCYGLTGGSACWLNPVPPPDAGPPADKVGNVCTSTANCINPPELDGVCLTSEFSLTWTGGYCSKNNCISNAECAADGGAICVGFSANQNACVRKCADSRDGGQSNCRPGYTCAQYVTVAPDGGQQPSTDGFCAP